MATFNTSHHESGGVILYNGELILLFCDNVNLSLPQTSQKVSFCELKTKLINLITGKWTSLLDYPQNGVHQ